MKITQLYRWKSIKNFVGFSPLIWRTTMVTQHLASSNLWQTKAKSEGTGLLIGCDANRESPRSFCGNIETISDTSRLRKIMATTKFIPSVLQRSDGT